MDKHPRNSTLVCTSETNKNGLQDLVEDHLANLLGLGSLCILKEFPAGHGGSVDFLAIDLEGRVFLVEVKRAKDQRAKFDVIFQVLKYYCTPNDIYWELFSPKRNFVSELEEQLGIDHQEASKLAEKTKANIEKGLMNPVIVVDEASYPLIAYAYAAVLRNIKGELRVVEMNMQQVRHGAEDAEFVYVRKYFSNDEWIGNRTLSNRKPTEYGSLDDALSRIPNQAINRKIARLLDEAGVRPRVAKNGKSFTIVEHKAYFTFDPSGTFAPSMFKRTARPKQPCRVVVIEEDPDVVRCLVDAGFHHEDNVDGTQTYHVYDLSPDTTDEDIDRLAVVLRRL